MHYLYWNAAHIKVFTKDYVQKAKLYYIAKNTTSTKKKKINSHKNN